jgi:hypothetical protein
MMLAMGCMHCRVHWLITSHFGVPIFVAHSSVSVSRYINRAVKNDSQIETCSRQCMIRRSSFLIQLQTIKSY